jgi:hypothetical protein
MLRVVLPVIFPALTSVDVRVPIEVVIVIDVDIAATPVAIPPVVVPGCS